MNSKFHKILTVVFSMLMLINTNCDPTNYAQPELHDYPTYFDVSDYTTLTDPNYYNKYPQFRPSE